MKYYYLPASAIRYDPITKQEVLTQQFAQMSPVRNTIICIKCDHMVLIMNIKLTINYVQMQMRIFDQGQTLYELAPNQTTAPKGAIRSCAISSLIMQVWWQATRPPYPPPLTPNPM